jgi:hypothetical protein
MKALQHSLIRRFETVVIKGGKSYCNRVGVRHPEMDANESFQQQSVAVISPYVRVPGDSLVKLET